MTLLELKNKVTTANRGHKLLKDKRDGLMQEFLTIVQRAKQLRKQVEQSLRDANLAFLEAQIATPRPFIENALAEPVKDIRIGVRTKTIMAVKIPEFTVEVTDRAVQYSALQTRASLDITLEKFSSVIALLVEVAETEKAAENMALEIEKTRRRVNALEHKMIPDLQDTLKYVKMRLGETERSAIVQVMAIKNLIEANENRNTPPHASA